MNLPYQQIFEFYEGDEVEKFTPLTGSTLNTASRQLQENIVALNAAVYDLIYTHENNSITRDEDLNKRISIAKEISENTDVTLRNYVDTKVSSIVSKDNAQIDDINIKVSAINVLVDDLNKKYINMDILIKDNISKIDEVNTKIANIEKKL